MTEDVLTKVRSALGRREPLKDVPIPPVIDEPITRLVHTDIGLPELFIKRVQENKMGVEAVHIEELVPKIVAFLRSKKLNGLAVPASPFLEKLGIVAGLKQAGFDVRLWPDMTLDEVYDIDCGITDVHAAVAETGSLVVRASNGHGRCLSLVPPVHVAIVQPKDLVPDLVDLFDKLGREGLSSATVLITGPSKTADIEMSLVTGVHGPGVVHVFMLE